MGVQNSKEMFARRRMDTATSSSSLPNMRYVMQIKKSKWRIFRKKEVAPIPTYTAASLKPKKGCPCGSEGPCKQKITPKGVALHYPEKYWKKKLFGASKAYIPPKSEKSSLGAKNARPKVKIIRERKFPTWRLDKIYYRPNFGAKMCYS